MQHQVHPVQISQWKKPLLYGQEDSFENGSASRRPDPRKAQVEPYEQIDRLHAELAWVEKIWSLTSRRGGVRSSRTTRT